MTFRSEQYSSLGNQIDFFFFFFFPSFKDIGLMTKLVLYANFFYSLYAVAASLLLPGLIHIHAGDWEITGIVLKAVIHIYIKKRGGKTPISTFSDLSASQINANRADSPKEELNPICVERVFSKIEKKGWFWWILNFTFQENFKFLPQNTILKKEREREINRQEEGEKY